jgi:hypothetical protein
MQFQQAVADFTLQVCIPLYWHDRQIPPPKELQGGSCFILKFKGKLVGITAAHVVQAYKMYVKRTATAICQLRTIPFELNDCLIDLDDDLDIATFSLNQAQLNQGGAVAIDCTGQWPPPEPARMTAVSIAGFPELLREVYPDRSATFKAYGALAAIEDFSDREIWLTYDPTRDQPMPGPVERPPVGFNMSGCSGGPVLMHETRAGLHRWFPVGIIYRGPRECPAGDAAHFDVIRVRRIHRVREDGSIARPSSGWLPR